MENTNAMVSLDVMVHWGDMDAMQHVNNIVYLKWIESTRLLLFEQLMGGTAGQEYISPILAWSDIKYIAPVCYPDTVHVEFSVTDMEEDRIQGEARLYSKKLNKLVAISKSITKAYNTKQLKKAAIPSQWKKRLKEKFGFSI